MEKCFFSPSSSQHVGVVTVCLLTLECTGTLTAVCDVVTAFTFSNTFLLRRVTLMYLNWLFYLTSTIDSYRFIKY